MNNKPRVIGVIILELCAAIRHQWPYTEAQLRLELSRASAAQTTDFMAAISACRKARN